MNNFMNNKSAKEKKEERKTFPNHPQRQKQTHFEQLTEKNRICVLHKYENNS